MSRADIPLHTDSSFDDDSSSHVVGSYSEAIARSMEMSHLLMGRSPWMGLSPSSGMTSREAQEVARNRSISLASSYRDGTLSGAGSARSVKLEDGAASDPFLRPVAIGSRSKYSTEEGGSGDYDPVTGEELPPLGDLDKLGDDMPPLSSYWQSVFNSSNLLVGVGLLSLPYTCKLAGWLAIPILILFAGMTNYTAKLLGRIMEYQSGVKLRDGPGAYTIYGFADMGMVAFGKWGKHFMTVLFIVETFGYACVYIIIGGENLKSQLIRFELFSDWRHEDFLMLSTCIFLPVMWLPNLSLLSNLSAFGVFASVFLALGVIAEGLLGTTPDMSKCKPPCTGSILHPSPTELYKLDDIPIVLGLVMVGFAGHAVFPTIKNDMAEKKHYDSMVDVTYVFVILSYVGIAAAGYLMFGDAADEQITLNLGQSVISQAIVWVIITNPICKYPLDMAPIAFGLESFFAITFKLNYNSWLYTFVSISLRTMLVFLSLAFVVAIPSFSLLVSLLGSIGSFTICITFPCACFLKLFWGEISLFTKVINTIYIIIGIVGMVVGVYSVIMHGGEP